MPVVAGQRCEGQSITARSQGRCAGRPAAQARRVIDHCFPVGVGGGDAGELAFGPATSTLALGSTVTANSAEPVMTMSVGTIFIVELTKGVMLLRPAPSRIWRRDE